MLAQIAYLCLCALMSWALKSLRPYVPEPYVCDLMSGFVLKRAKCDLNNVKIATFAAKS